MFLQEACLQVVGCRTEVVVRFTAGLPCFVGLAGFLHALKHGVLLRQSSGNGLNPPRTEKQEAAEKASLWSVFLAT